MFREHVDDWTMESDQRDNTRPISIWEQGKKLGTNIELKIAPVEYSETVSADLVQTGDSPPVFHSLSRRDL